MRPYGTHWVLGRRLGDVLGLWETFGGRIGSLAALAALAPLGVSHQRNHFRVPSQIVSPSRRLPAKCVLVLKIGEEFLISRGGECAIFFSLDQIGLWRRLRGVV